jgi:hypothetical protein
VASEVGRLFMPSFYLKFPHREKSHGVISKEHEDDSLRIMSNAKTAHDISIEFSVVCAAQKVHGFLVNFFLGGDTKISYTNNSQLTVS